MQRHEALGAEIYGVGVGLDLSPYYSRSHVRDLSGAVGMAVLREIISMIGHGAQLRLHGRAGNPLHPATHRVAPKAFGTWARHRLHWAPIQSGARSCRFELPH